MAEAVAGWINAAIAGRGVAVVCCSWHQSIEEIRAVRMVVVRAW
jgi:hypothetical protein